jgi:hypothetical protein
MASNRVILVKKIITESLKNDESILQLFKKQTSFYLVL